MYYDSLRALAEMVTTVERLQRMKSAFPNIASCRDDFDEDNDDADDVR